MKKVLLVCLDNLGDLVFTSALAQALQADPDVELSVWCKEYTARIAHFLPGVRKVYAADPFWDKAPLRGRGQLRHFLRSWRSIRRAGFDIALLPTTCWRLALFTKMAGIPQRWGLAGRKNTRFLTRALPAPGRHVPVVAGLMQSFAPLLPPGSRACTVLERQRLPPLLLPPPLCGQRIAVLHAFAGRSDRCAPLEIWEQLATQLRGWGYFILWTGMSSELATLRQRWPELEPRHFIDTWAQDLETLAWLWAQAALFIGHDSGPLHVAHAFGVPVVGLYLPGEPLRTFPQGEAPSLVYHAASPAAIDRVQLQTSLETFVVHTLKLSQDKFSSVEA